MSIEITTQGNNYEVEQFTFPGGEVQVRVPELPTALVDLPKDSLDVVHVHAKIRSSDDVMALLLTTSILDIRVVRTIVYVLHLHYFPYARQDRACQVGEAESMKVFAGLINSLGFDTVHIWDLHNEDMLRWINNVSHDNQYVFSSRLLYAAKEAYDYVVAPDKGALPKIEDKLRNIDPGFRPKLIVGEKVRDPSNGQITHTAISYEGSLAGKKLLIMDDICDGGRTFVELAKVLQKENPAQIDLYVTHGIFSKGLQVFEGLIDNVYTTDSFYDTNNRSTEEAWLAGTIPVFVYTNGKFIEQGV